ncbi:MAG: hypothetical protein EXR79_09455 [Myxococcales bacterium]|nr:hypothetical protein [Myxococcales bacterium]
MRAEVAKGIAATGEAMAPLEAWAPVDAALHPSMGHLRGTLTARWDYAATARLRLRAEGDVVYAQQPAASDRSPWLMAGYAGVDVRTSARTRVTLGGYLWNQDQHEVAVTKGVDGYGVVERVRTLEGWPTVDFVWTH